MNSSHQSEQDSKTAAIKTLAIIGFIITIVFFVWLAVQAVRIAPQAFHSLASLAETVYGTQKPFEMQIEKKVVNVDEPLVVSWNRVRTAGSYAFSFQCTEGISAEARNEKGDIVTIPCDAPFSLAATTERFEILFSSEKKRFTDIPVSLIFTPEKDPSAPQEKRDLVTVVNATIAEGIKPAPIPEAATTTPPVVTKEDTPPAKPAVSPKPSKPAPTPVITTVFPISNPNGYTDLQTSFMSIGTFNEGTKAFTPTTALDNDLRGAIRFEVKNIGTKTSGDWVYSVTLPNSGDETYTSPIQTPLKPNERAVVTIAFGDLSEKVGTDTVRVAAAATNDTITANNAFSWIVKIVD